MLKEMYHKKHFADARLWGFPDMKKMKSDNEKYPWEAAQRIKEILASLDWRYWLKNDARN